MSEWSPEVNMTAQVVDAVRSVASILVKANSKGGRGPDPKPVARPRTAIDRAERLALEKRMNVLIKQVLPTKPGGDAE